MNTRQILRSLTVLFLITGCRSEPIPERPNIIFIFTDDHSPRAISAYGSNINQTPNTFMATKVKSM